MKGPILEFYKVNKFFPGITVLKELSFKVFKGRIHGLLGLNGAGKTTTMKIIAKALKHSSGRVTIHGKVGYLPENPPLYTDMLVHDFLKFQAQIHGVKGKEVALYIEEVIDRVRIKNVSKRLIGNLSKGYRQRVGLAGTLVYKPSLLILDEPTVGLDPSSIRDIRNLIKSLRGEQTILFSTHQLHEAELLCEDLSIINQGSIIIDGPMKDILFNSTSKVVCDSRVESFKEDDRKFFKNLPFIKFFEEKKDDKHKFHCLKFHLESNNPDFKSRLTGHLVERGCGLLSFSNREMDLEEFFLKVLHTKKGVESSEHLDSN